ncbi:MAG: hypothetical protein B7Z10_08045 [Rhodobacterales bacterium 32-66-7]|nr:MAG: hypothetical protein B7Z31_04765 [Rhodobacterales bacterium 12-65-15]OYX24856.1 MAG: hypothetical protein B7Z10_08045 [Rhodobacterales bacterium 32-66-7]
MSFAQILDLLRNRGEMLISGEVEPLMAEFVFPLPIYLPGRRIVLTSTKQARPYCEVVRTALCDRGVVALRPRVTAMELPRGGRFRVWVDWYELALPVQGTRLTSAVYFMKSGAAGPLTEMISYESPSMPEVCARVEDLMLSA